MLKTTAVLRAGLDKALASEIEDARAFCLERIESWAEPYSDEMLQWRMGSFAWGYVQETLHFANSFLLEVEKMGRKPTTGGNKNSRKQLSYTFVRCELRKEDKEACKTWIAKSQKDLATKLHSLMAEGTKISISLSTEKDTFTASGTGQEGAVNEGLILTARHKDWWTAVATLLYKHEVLFESGMWEGEDEDEDGWS